MGKENKVFIYKWRVKAMLNYIKRMIEDGEEPSDILEVVSDYIDFIDEIK